MASYRYERDIDPKDLKPRKQRQYSRKERWANWWDYNLKWVLIFGIAGAFVAYCFIGQYFLTTHPDYNVAVVSPYYLPEATVTALQQQLAAYGEDCNGDGKVVVKLNQYTMAFNSEDSDAYLDMAGTTKLSTDIQSSLSSIFILYDPAGFQQTTGTLRYLDGHLPKSDADSDWWNMVYRWTDCPVLTGMELGSYTSDAVQSASGDSQQLLADYPAATLHETIKNFHNTVDRFHNFLKAVEEDVVGRAKDVQAEIEFVKAREADCHIICDALANGEIPLRVTHNDTKLNNVMIDNKTGKGLCVIDLDTVMPGSALYDYGDSIRFGASTAAEDEQNLDLVSCDMNLFEIYTKGYTEGCAGSLTEKEIRLMPMGAKLMTLECGMRFLADHLQNDIYFKIHRENHNLDRARTQFKLVADMEAKWDQMNAIVEKYL